MEYDDYEYNDSDEFDESASCDGKNNYNKRSSSTHRTTNQHQHNNNNNNKTKNKKNKNKNKNNDNAFENEKIDFGGDLNIGIENKKRKNKYNRDATYCRIPPHPIPASWSHDITHYKNDENEQSESMIGQKYIENDILSMTAKDFPHNNYLAVLIDCPFDLSNSIVNPQPGIVSLQQFSKLPMKDIVPNGMIFMWTPAELTYEIIRIIESWNFHFVEHATYCMKNILNRFVMRPTRFFNTSKHNLLLFRKFNDKGNYSRLELRHQRTPDVHFDFVCYNETFDKHELKCNEYAYSLIETLLPLGLRNLKENPVSTMLYLWAPKDEKRKGWTTICDMKHMEFLKNQQ